MNCFGNDSCEVRCNDSLGRYVIASRNLKAGELLLCEQPAIIGPYWDSKICCLHCYAESSRMCPRCRIAPLCDRCSSHESYECAFLATSGLPVNFLLDNFDLITPLRCILLAGDPQRAESFAAVWRMESHCVQRRDTSIWRLHGRNVVEPMQSLLGEQLGAERTAEEFVQRMCGILDVNTFEVRTPHFEEIPVRGLYPMAALLPHDCISNTFLTVDDVSRELRVYTALPIARGETVYNNYTSTLLGTAARRAHLWVGKYFRCECPRCADPTELGTHFSSLRCEADQCSSADARISFDGDAVVWSCNMCGARPSDAGVQERLAKARALASAAGLDAGKLELVLEQQKQLLCGEHYLVVETKQKLAAVLRGICDEQPQQLRRRKVVADVPRLLALKVQLCGELLPVLRVLKPGISRLTAIALFENFTALLRIAEQKRISNTISAEEYGDELIKAELLAKECVAMLVYEPHRTPEGNLAKNAMQYLRKLRDEIANWKKNTASVEAMIAKVD